MNPNKIADTVQNLITNNIDKVVNRTYKRGIIATTNGQIADVYIEGNAVATKNIIAMDSYEPIAGHKVLVLSIGNSGSNLVILGSINGNI